MDTKLKQQWSKEEAVCLLALWSSAEVQEKLESTSGTNSEFEKIQIGMATVRYNAKNLWWFSYS